MTAHHVNNALLDHARALCLLPTATHRLGIDALRQLSRATGMSLKALRRWNNQRNSRLTHKVRGRACFTDKDGRDFLRDMFVQDARPSVGIMQQFAEELGVRAADVAKYFRRQRYNARQRALCEAALDFIVIPADVMGEDFGVGGVFEPGRRACVFFDVDAEEL